MKSVERWGLKWESYSKFSGKRTHFIYENCVPVLFRTRAEARKYADEKYGYIKTRKDLRSEPHGWKMPIPVRAILVEVKP